MSERSREMGLLFGQRQASMDRQTPMKGRYIAVDLDNGAFIGAELDDTDGLTMEMKHTETYRGGKAILPDVLQALESLLGLDTAAATTLLLDAQAMNNCYEKARNAEYLEDPEIVCLSKEVTNVTYGQLTESLFSLTGDLQALADRALAYLGGYEGNTRIVVCGTAARFAPLQYALRRAMHRDDEDYAVYGEDSLFCFIPDDGGLIRRGWEVMAELEEKAQWPRNAQQNVSLRLLSANADGEPSLQDIVLWEKGWQAEQYGHSTEAFFSIPNAQLCLIVDGQERLTPLPAGFLDQGDLITVEPTLQEKTISLLLRKAGSDDIFTIDI